MACSRRSSCSPRTRSAQPALGCRRLRVAAEVRAGEHPAPGPRVRVGRGGGDRRGVQRELRGERRPGPPRCRAAGAAARPRTARPWWADRCRPPRRARPAPAGSPGPDQHRACQPGDQRGGGVRVAAGRRRPRHSATGDSTHSRCHSRASSSISSGAAVSPIPASRRAALRRGPRRRSPLAWRWTGPGPTSCADRPPVGQAPATGATAARWDAGSRVLVRGGGRPQQRMQPGVEVVQALEVVDDPLVGAQR